MIDKNKLFKISVLTIFLLAPIVGASAQVNPSQEARMFWDLETDYGSGSSGDTVIDQANNYDGTTDNADTGINGVIDNAHSYPQSGYVDGSNLSFDASSTGVTVAGWVKPDSLTVNDDLEGNHIMGMDTDQGQRNFRLMVDNTDSSVGNTISYVIYDGSNNNVVDVPGSDVSTSNWQFIAGVYDPSASEMKIYHNGTFKDSKSVTTSQSISTFRAGMGSTSQGANDLPYDGDIDEAMVYDQPLSETELDSLYNKEYQLNTNVSFSNFNPADGSTYAVDQSETFTVDVSVDSNDYQTVDIEGNFGGNIETVENITADGTTNTVSFTKDFSNTGTDTFDYSFDVISDSSSGTELDSTETRSVTVESDSADFDTPAPTNGEQFYRLDNANAKPYNIFFDWELNTSNDEEMSIEFVIERPDGSTFKPVEDSNVPKGSTISRSKDYEVGSQLGQYRWYLKATGETSGDVYKLADQTFTINEEEATINIIDPKSNTLDGYSLNVTNTAESNFFDYSIDTTGANNIESGYKSGTGGDVSGVTEFEKYSGYANIKYDMPDNQDAEAINYFSDNLDVSGDQNEIDILYNFQTYFNGNNEIRFYKESNPSHVDTPIASYSLSLDSTPSFGEEYGWANFTLTDNGDGTHTISSNIGGDQTVDSSNLNDFSVGMYRFYSTADNEVSGGNLEIYATKHDLNSSDNTARSVPYLEDMPIELNVSANTKDDQTVNFEIDENGTNILRKGISGDGTVENIKDSVTKDKTVLGLPFTFKVIGSDGFDTIGSKTLNLDILDRPEFNLTQPENGSRVEADDINENNIAEDTTNFKADINIGESGTATIQVKEPNGTYQNVTDEQFKDSDINSNVTISGSQILENITLNEVNDENVLLSDDYNFRVLFDGDDSGENFNSTENSYKYVNQIQGIIEYPIQLFKNFNDRIKDASGESGQFFIATLIILAVSAFFHSIVENDIFAISSMVLMALGFSFADGYYPLGVFWILIAVVGLASAYFGSRVLGGKS